MVLCPYARRGRCDTPRTNKGNSDAACHRMPNKTLLGLLVQVDDSANIPNQPTAPGGA